MVSKFILIMTGAVATSGAFRSYPLLLLGCACLAGCRTEQTAPLPRLDATAAPLVTTPQPPSPNPITTHHPKDIGLQLPYGGESPEARAHIDMALMSARKGELSTAQQQLQEADKAAPDWPLVRYHLTVIATLREEFETASTLLQSVLRQDLPGFVSKWRSAPELAALRQSSHSTRINQTIAELDKQWRNALREGLSLAHQERLLDRTDHVGESEDPYKLKTSKMRAGIYLAEGARFLPVGPEPQAALAAWLQKGGAEVLVLSADRYFGLPSSLGSAFVQRYDAMTGASLGSAIPLARGYEGPEVLELGLQDGTTFLRATNHEISNSALPPSSGWMNLHNGELDSSVSVAPELTLMAEGAIVATPATNVSRSQGSNTMTYHWVARNNYGAWKLEVHSGCLWNVGDEAQPYLRHSLQFTGPDNKSHVVSAGNHSASVKLLDGGDLLLQIGQDLLHLAASEGVTKLTSARKLPPGLILAHPLSPKTCFSP